MRTPTPTLRVPETVPVAGAEVRVRRVWPDADDARTPGPGTRFVLEAVDTEGKVRAGTLTWADTDSDPVATLAPYGRDDRLPALAAAAPAGRVVGHRLGKRAVVAHEDRFVKVVRGRVTARVVDAARRAAALDDGETLQTPRVLSSAPGELALSPLDGEAAHALAAGTELGTWYAWWSAWARTWQRLVRRTDGWADGADVPVHGAAQEVDVLAGWVRRARRDGVVGPGSLDRAHAGAVASLTRPGSGPGAGRALVLAHRDLHDKQIFFTAGSARVGLLDFDTLAWAEPALDLANLAVHADLRERQGLWSPDHAAVVRSAVLGCAAALGVPDTRLRAYARASTVRLACVYAYRPPWQRLAADLLLDPPALTGWPVVRPAAATTPTGEDERTLIRTS